MGPLGEGVLFGRVWFQLFGPVFPCSRVHFHKGFHHLCISAGLLNESLYPLPSVPTLAFCNTIAIAWAKLREFFCCHDPVLRGKGRVYVTLFVIIVIMVSLHGSSKTAGQERKKNEDAADLTQWVFSPLVFQSRMFVVQPGKCFYAHCQKNNILHDGFIRWCVPLLFCTCALSNCVLTNEYAISKPPIVLNILHPAAPWPRAPSSDSVRPSDAIKYGGWGSL